MILDDHTIERPWDWVFFYTSRKWREGDPRFAIAGNGPYFVNRFDGTMRAVGTGQPLEYYLQQYEQGLGETEDPNSER